MLKAMAQGPYCATFSLPEKSKGLTAKGRLELEQSDKEYNHMMLELDANYNNRKASDFYDESLYSMPTYEEFECTGENSPSLVDQSSVARD
jgi:hypothetical protein